MKQHTIPQAAETAGYRRLTFCDDFDDASTVDWQATGKLGFNWYIDRPFNWSTLSEGDIKVENSVMTIAQKDCCANWAVGTYSAKGNTGHAFRYGYFEARIRFDTTKNHSEVSGFPAWWSFSVKHTTDCDKGQWAELDFFEAMTNPESNGDYTGTYVATVHDWRVLPERGVVNCQNDNCWNDRCVTEGWHDYGCLWTPGVIEWYYDGTLVARVTYAADALPQPNNHTSFVGSYSFMDTEDMLLILGSCKEWPMEVDWVHVWQE